MARKPPPEERKIILARDHRRKYGARITFRVLFPEQVGSLANVTILLPDGSYGRIRPGIKRTSELGIPFELDVEAFPSAAEAEIAGLKAAQALLLTSLNLDFGVRLEYANDEPATVFDRTVSSGSVMSGELFGFWPEDVVVRALTDSFSQGLRDRRMQLSMELLASSTLESNDRARFVMAVSALEPLAEQQELGSEVSEFVQQALSMLASNTAISPRLRPSLEGRIRQLRKESVRQALGRLCDTWFPGEPATREYIEYVYSLRSQILHEGRAADLDIVLEAETRNVRRYIRRIYEREFAHQFRVSTAA